MPDSRDWLPDRGIAMVPAVTWGVNVVRANDSGPTRWTLAGSLPRRNRAGLMGCQVPCRGPELAVQSVCYEVAHGLAYRSPDPEPHPSG